MNHLVRLTLLIGCLWPGHLRAQVRIDNVVLKPDAKKHGLKGQVWKITQTQSPLSNKSEDLLDGYSGQNYTEEYNRQGYLQKHTYHDDFNKPRSATHYEYDSNGRVTALWIESLAPDQFGLRTDGRIDYEYNPARNAFVVHDNRTVMGKVLHRRTETVRDTINRMLTTHEYQRDTLLTQDQRYWWDSYGYVTKQISRIRNQPSTRTELKKEDFTRLLGALSEQEERVIDSLMRARDSLETRQYKSRPEWMVDTTIYHNKYDKQGRFVSQEQYRNNKRTDITRYTYRPDATEVFRQSFDQEGNLISGNTSRQHSVDRHILTDSSRHRIDGKWEISNYNYESYKKPVNQYRYDSHGNWIEQKQIDTAGKQVGPALVRTIEYY